MRGNIDKSILANNALAQLSSTEKTMYDVPLQGIDIQKWNHPVDTYIEFIDGIAQR